MHRRELFKAFVMGPFCGYWHAGPPKFGRVDPYRWAELAAQGVHLHVFYQGQDVTTRCRFADDTGDGMAELFSLNSKGSKYVDMAMGKVAMEIVYGGVEIRAGDQIA